MKEIVKVLLEKGIDEETIHEVLDVIQEMDNPEKKHEMVHNERVKRSKEAEQDLRNANRASAYYSYIKNPEVNDYSTQHGLHVAAHNANMKSWDAKKKLDKADNLIKRHSQKILGKKAEMSSTKQGVKHIELTDFDKEMAKKYGIY